MGIKVAGGVRENGVVVGNAYDKYGSRNWLVKRIMAGFEFALSGLVERAAPKSIHEIGCGEGYWVLRWLEEGRQARGCDFSTHAIDLARQNADARALDSERVFDVRSIYDLQSAEDSADLVVCCEVLEHLEDPDAGMRALQRVATGHLILSVPREPLWCVLNLARGKYIGSLGNTPGHLQHWSARGFVRWVEQYFEVIEVRSPLPWTMLLCRPRR
ncbi:class I SAM-dependent methyltransferase [Pseudomonas sp. BGr12]|uniref:class I SAM-dependent methyltransferase n=1 Tax=unclassified Pseudomonas TaxID=196821 RepID=UPI001CE1D2C5|nr:MULTISPECIES: class I SAM-dependent methyltransferase [unclassified Pseudomonas]MDL2426849.1 class I SAM-dependent methyltransferase [Pseudomonas sp. BJa5]